MHSAIIQAENFAHHDYSYNGETFEENLYHKI